MKYGFLLVTLILLVALGGLTGCKTEEKKADPDAAKKELEKLREERQKEPWPK